MKSIGIYVMKVVEAFKKPRYTASFFYLMESGLSYEQALTTVVQGATGLRKIEKITEVCNAYRKTVCSKRGRI